MDCNPPGSCVRGILQVRMLDWVALPSSRGSLRPRDRTLVDRTLLLMPPEAPVALQQVEFSQIRARAGQESPFFVI